MDTRTSFVRILVQEIVTLLPPCRALLFIQLMCGILYMGACASRSQPHSFGETGVDSSLKASDVSPGVDTTVRFQTEVRVDSTLSPGEIVGSVISASTGNPIQGAIVLMEFRNHRHMSRSVITGSDGTFRITGLPAEGGTLHSSMVSFRPDSLAIDERDHVIARFALRVNPFVPSCYGPQPAGYICQ